MSNINYDIYGTSEQWTHWQNATPQSGLQGTLWGQQRIGASDWTNDDFTNYPYFMFGKETIYRNYKNSGYIDINTPFDDSIAYGAMANPDLPQQNVMLFDYQHNTLNNPIANTTPENITPFAFSWYYFGTSHISNPAYQGSLYGFDGFPNDAIVFGSQGMQRISPYAMWDSTYVNTWGMYNPNLRIAPCVKFGVKSIILEINVAYKTTGDYPTAESSLKDYLNHTSEWLQQHKVISAYCKPYYRTNINGTYISSNAATSTDRFGGISTLFFRPYNIQGIDIYNYTAYLSSDLNISGNLPIYGRPLTDGSYTAVDVYGYHNYDNPSQTNMNSYACLFGINRGDFIKTVSSGQISCHMELDLSIADNVEYIMRGAAAYGLFFCKAIGNLGNSGRDTGDNERWLDSEMYCGIITDAGLTFGDYTQGEDNAENSVYGWIDSTQTPYEPGLNPDPTHYDYDTTLPNYLVGDTENYYSDKNIYSHLVPQDFLNIKKLMYGITEIADNPDNKQFMFQEPLKAVLDFRRIFMTQPHTNEDTVEPVPLGAFQLASFSGAPGFNRYRRENLGSHNFWRTYNNFIDFEPYTQAVLYVPYCGTKQLPMNIFSGHTVNIYMNADNATGEIEILIFVDNIEWGTMHGMASEELPLIGETAMTAANTVRELDYQYTQNEFSKLTGIAGSLAGASISAAFGNPMGVVTQGIGAGLKAASMTMQSKEIQYQIDHTKPEPLSIQKGSANIERINVQYPFIMIQSPIIIKNNNESEEDAITRYGKIKGFKCCETGVIGDFHGLTKCSSAILDGISCTYTEKQMLLEALQEGVIL